MWTRNIVVHTVPDRLSHTSLWSTTGAVPGTRNLAGGMATSGAITGWLRELFDPTGYEELLALAEAAGPGANGLLMLPYFAGERTPVMDPDARGVLAGLTLSHTRGDVYRAALEAIGLGVRHNVETMTEAGGEIRRIVAVGGGTQGGLWTQIVSDVTGLDQVLPTVTIGASFGAAFLAAGAVAEVSIEVWNPPVDICRPDPELTATYEELYHLYRELYRGTAPVAHALAERQRRSSS